jgi:dynactin 1
MADLIGRYASDIRLSHSALAVETLKGILQEATIDLGIKGVDVLVAIDTDLALAVSSLSKGLEAVLDSEQVVTGAFLSASIDRVASSQERTVTHSPPWTERVAEIAASAAHTLDAEQRAHKLSDELRDVRRELRVREQSMQESAVKIEVMDRRMEAVKKQVRPNPFHQMTGFMHRAKCAG